MMIEICCEKHSLDGCIPTIRHILSEALNLTLEELDPLSSGDSMRYRLCQRPRYRLEQYISARHAQQESLSGDTAVSFTDSTGNPCLVLSDGMGSGSLASSESCMMLDTMEELLKLPGVGRKTANLLLGDLYGAPGAVVCDTHCIRISNRLGLA